MSSSKLEEAHQWLTLATEQVTAAARQYFLTGTAEWRAILADARLNQANAEHLCLLLSIPRPALKRICVRE